MNFTIGEVAEKMGVSVHTLRYYDKEGLLPFVERHENGRRIFHERDIILLNTIECLKKTGMALKDIRQYVIWCEEGYSSVSQRLQLMENRKQEVQKQIDELVEMMTTIEHKCEFYRNAIETGTTDMCDEERASWANEILSMK